MESIFQSFLLVALSEMGDKTQLLALVLTVRFKTPWPILWGILVATLLNHALASYAGGWISTWIDPQVLKYGLGALFIIFALWLLVPDKHEDDGKEHPYGAFVTTLVTFFLAEMGDKTQLATVALGARFQAPLLVTVGTTLGMMFSDGLAVLFGEKLIEKVPMNVIRMLAAAMFIGFGILVLIKA